MSSLGYSKNSHPKPIPKPKPSPPKEEEEEEEEEEVQEIVISNVSPRDQEDPETMNWVSTHLHLKPAHSSGTLDKEVVLRRIRQRRRANKVQAAVQSTFFGLPFPAKRRKDSNHNRLSIKWVDDAFAAP